MNSNSPEFRTLGGKKLIDWSINNLFKSKIIDEVIISSPDENVLNYVKKKKNKRLIAIKRSSTLASSNVMIDQSINQAIQYYKKKKFPSIYFGF